MNLFCLVSAPLGSSAVLHVLEVLSLLWPRCTVNTLVSAVKSSFLYSLRRDLFLI